MRPCMYQGCTAARHDYSYYCVDHKCCNRDCKMRRDVSRSIYCVGCQRDGTRLKIAYGKDYEMSRFYSHLLGETLKSKVEQHLRAPLEEQQQCLEELAIMRVVAGDAVAMYSAILEHPITEQYTEEKKRNLLLGAGAMVRSAMEDVLKAVKLSADIQQKNSGEVTLLSLTMVVQQLNDMMYDVCGKEFHFIAQKFQKLCDEQLRLPKRLGTTKEPGQTIDVDAQVAAMDNMIPVA